MDPLPVLESERVPRSSRWRQVFEMDETVQAQIARLTSDVQHVQTDVADIKVALRRFDDKLDALNARIDGVRTDLTEKFESLRGDVNAKIDGLRSEISSMKVWALSLYFALAGSLLFVMAKGFKWF
jgi:chromosome segregation ATPase